MYSVKRNAKRLKRYRKKAGLIPAEVAKRLYIADSTYRMYENGSRNPSDEITEKIAELFNTSVQVLFFDK